jgi:hypothetical protein
VSREERTRARARGHGAAAWSFAPSTAPARAGPVGTQVDGQWRLAAGWPVELDDAGNEVNVLTVV